MQSRSSTLPTAKRQHFLIDLMKFQWILKSASFLDKEARGRREAEATTSCKQRPLPDWRKC